MALVADRFLTLDGRADEALDLATGERAHLFVDAHASVADARARAAICDRLAALRHPLLRPLVDYGTCGARWFEAHAPAGPVRLSRPQMRRWVLHLVRFLREAGVELSAQSTARHIRTAIEGGAAAGRPVGVFLRDRGAIDAVRTVLESGGPPGTTAIDLHGGDGAGLRTARWQLARIARLAGYVVLDARTKLSVSSSRHVCVLDWLPRDRLVPAVLADAGGARRHVWIRFGRDTAASAAALRLEPMMNDELTAAIFADRELGPTPAEVRVATRSARGWPGIAIGGLAGLGDGKGAGWVHETAPEYGAAASAPDAASCAPGRGRAGIGRLERAVAAAAALAARGRHARAVRVLSRCAPAFAARGAPNAASAAASDLGDLLLTRAQPVRAVQAFEQARAWATDADGIVRALVGVGRGLLEQTRLAEAEAMLRTAAAAADGSARAADVRHWLARTLWHRGQLDAAQAAAGDGSPALLARILLSMGHVEAAAHAAHRALLDAAPGDHEAACHARLASAYVQAALGDEAGVRHHASAAVRAARHAAKPTLKLIATADTLGCLDDCGVAVSAAARDRLLKASSRLPPLTAARVRVALHRPREGDAGLVPARRTDHELIRRFEALVDAMHDAPDEAAALEAIAADLLRALDACSVVIRSARCATWSPSRDARGRASCRCPVPC